MWIDKLALILTIVGGLNWGLVGIADLNLVTLIFGTIPVLVNIIYIVVGIASIYTIYAYLAK